MPITEEFFLLIRGYILTSNVVAIGVVSLTEDKVTTYAVAIGAAPLTEDILLRGYILTTSVVAIGLTSISFINRQDRLHVGFSI